VTNVGGGYVGVDVRFRGREAGEFGIGLMSIGSELNMNACSIEMGAARVSG
jgi:hypothetical protein